MSISLSLLILLPQPATLLLVSLLHLMWASTFSRPLKSFQKGIRKSPWGFIRVLHFVWWKRAPYWWTLYPDIYATPFNSASSGSIPGPILAFLVGIPLLAPAAPLVSNPSHPLAGLNFSNWAMLRFDPSSWFKVGWGSRSWEGPALSYKVPASTESSALSSNKGWLLSSSRGSEHLYRPGGSRDIWGSKAAKRVCPDIPIPSLRVLFLPC